MLTKSETYGESDDRIKDYVGYMSKAAIRREPSPISTLGSYIRLKDMISFGGGLPAPSTYPITSIQFKDLAQEWHELPYDKLMMGMMYSEGDGIPIFKKTISQLQAREHNLFHSKEWDICITNGSQDGIGKTLELLANHGDKILVETPNYSGTLAFAQPLYEIIGVETDKFGLIPSNLDQIATANPEAKVLYLVPTGGNPHGATIPLKRRQEIYSLCCKHDIILIEDDPYHFLYFCDSPPVSFLSLDSQGRVLRLDSMSKLVAPGLRLGVVTGPKPLIEKITLHCQAGHFHACGISQMLVQHLFSQWGEEGFRNHVAMIRQHYRSQRDTMISALEKHVGTDLAEWSHPNAGMFIWIRVKTTKDTSTMIRKRAPEAKVLFLCGQDFMPDGRQSQYIRASYSYATPQQIDEGIRRLGVLLRTMKAEEEQPTSPRTILSEIASVTRPRAISDNMSYSTRGLSNKQFTRRSLDGGSTIPIVTSGGKSPLNGTACLQSPSQVRSTQGC